MTSTFPKPISLNEMAPLLPGKTSTPFSQAAGRTMAVLLAEGRNSPRLQWVNGVASLTEAEVERRRLSGLRLKEQLSSIPFYARRAKEQGENYWTELYSAHPLQ